MELDSELLSDWMLEYLETHYSDVAYKYRLSGEYSAKEWEIDNRIDFLSMAKYLIQKIEENNGH
jgi:hypothetical protein